VGGFLRAFVAKALVPEMAKPDVNRLFLALLAYVVLALLAWFTIDDAKVRLIPLALLVLFALRSILWHVRSGYEAKTDNSED